MTSLNAKQVVKILTSIPSFITKDMNVMDSDGDSYGAISKETMDTVAKELKLADTVVYMHGSREKVTAYIHKVTALRRSMDLFSSQATIFSGKYSKITLSDTSMARAFLDSFLGKDNRYTFELQESRKAKASEPEASYFKIMKDDRLIYLVYFVLNSDAELKIALCRASSNKKGIIFGRLDDLCDMLDRLVADDLAYQAAKKGLDKRLDEDDADDEYDDDDED